MALAAESKSVLVFDPPAQPPQEDPSPQAAYRAILDKDNYNAPSQVPTPTSEWNEDRERALVNRLFVRKEPTYTIDVEEVRTREEEECSHKPHITPLPRPSGPREPPKCFDDAVARIQKAAVERRSRREAEEGLMRDAGARLAKLRRMKSNPPSFLNRTEMPRKKEVQLYVDVAVMPGR